MTSATFISSDGWSWTQAEIEPALRALVDLAQHIDGGQQRQQAAIQQVGQPEPQAQVDQGDRHHHRQADGQPHAVPPGPGLWRAAGRPSRAWRSRRGPSTRSSATSGQCSSRSFSASGQLDGAQPGRARGAHVGAAGGGGHGLRRAPGREQLERLAHDVARDGRGHLGTALPVLDHDRHGEARLRIGREADEQRVVAIDPGDVLALVAARQPGRRLEMRRTCEVPVLPPISMPGRPRAAALAVPRAPWTTSCMPRSTISSALLRHAHQARRRRRRPAGRTSHGFTARPPLASRAAITASCSGVAST